MDYKNFLVYNIHTSQYHPIQYLYKKPIKQNRNQKNIIQQKKSNLHETNKKHHTIHTNWNYHISNLANLWNKYNLYGRWSWNY